MIYLDNAATTKPSEEVVNAIMPYFTDMWNNPSSLYSPSPSIKNKIEESREIIANFINANNDEIYFTSGGSEGNSWAIQGFIKECWLQCKQPVIITSKIEHKSILNCVNDLDLDIYIINVDNKGFVNLNVLEDTLKIFEHQEKYYGVLVSIQFANNEIGTCQHIKMISDIVHKYGGVFHTDAVQAFGHITINVKELGIDMMTTSGHKINAFKGSGFLYKKNGVKIKPLIYGTQENGLRGGTENVIGIIGLGEAVKHISFGTNYNRIEEMCDKRDYFIRMLENKFGCILNGCYEYRLPNNVNVTFPQNITGEALLYMLDMADIKVSTGSACNSHSIEPSYVLKAIGLTDSGATRTIRFSLSDNISYDDIDYVVREIDKALKIIELERIDDN